ncbi:contact-dependent growth inhibition system immunity protein [Photorhabdus asymbiotica]|uniref:contact-dependent growth inhibition system immunity protein n=1 Tax=Photorhabdus asymbiotica TaxID=291112 RepID=UPI003DA707A2
MELNRLMFAYFNQDYDIISGPELDDVINDYLDTTNEAMKKNLIQEIAFFIHNSENIEKDFQALYYSSSFCPKLWDTTALEFLNYVSKRTQDFLSE